MKTTSNKLRKTAAKVAYLTFDDGPLKNTAKILAVLKQHKVKGTFFVIGSKSPYGIRMYRKIHKLGHSIGNHTYSHNFSTIYASKKAFFADFYQMERLLYQTIGINPRLFRFPGGSNTRKGFARGGQKTIRAIKAALRSRGYLYSDWDIDSADSTLPRPTQQQIIGKVLQESRLRQNCIILFHDFSANSLLALPAIIRGLKRQGFRFDVLSTRSYNYQIAEGQ
jgi:peptidoglycan-N-acetylglucosamine deacetylase